MSIPSDKETQFFYKVLLIVPFVFLVSIPVVEFFYVAISRAAYPFALEWQEGNLYLNILRVIQRKPLYLPPSNEFVSSLYTPFYFYAASFFALITRNIMFSMRITSILATILTGISIFAICRRLRCNLIEALIAVGIFFASYKLTDFFYDLGRVDSLVIGLIALSAWLSLYEKNRISYGFLIGATLALAFLTKQHAILAAVFLIFYLIFRREWKTATGAAITIVTVILGFYLACDLYNGNWAFIYTILIPSSSPIVKHQLIVFIRDLFVSIYWPLLIIIVLGAAVMIKRHKMRELISKFVILGCITIPLFIIGIGTYIKIWGYLNALGAVAAAMGIITAFCISEIRRALLPYQHETMKISTSYGLFFLLLITQLWILRYNPASQIPDPQNIEKGYQLLERIKRLPQPIFTPAASYLFDLAGLPTNYHMSSFSDIALGAKYNSDVEAIYKQYSSQVTSSLETGRYRSAIMSDVAYFDKYFSIDEGYDCEEFPIPILKTIDGANSYLKGICVKR